MKRVSLLIAAITAVALVAGPVAAQLPDVPLPDDTPDVEEIVALEDLPPLLDPADPILDTVTETIAGLQALIDDVLAEVPLLNILGLQGDDAIDAAVAFSQATFDTSDTAVLARDDIFADGLTTGALQGIYDAPMLLTASGDLDPRTASELVRLGVENLIILGGDDAVDDLVAQKLEIAGLEVARVGGPTRIETATMAAGVSAPDATTAVLTRAYPSLGADDSQAFADLLAVSPWAAENDWPVLLSQTEELTASVEQYLADSAITELIIIGGDSAISPATQQAIEAMGITVSRVGGDNRFATAVAIAAQRGFDSSADTDRLILAEGTDTRPDIWAPGFAGAAHGARNTAPILLTAGNDIPTETLTFITDGIAGNITDGGPATICATFVSPIACEAAGLLLLGDLSGLDLLGLSLGDLTNVEQLITLIEEVLGVDLSALEGILDDPVGAIGDTVDDVVGDTVDDVVDDVVGDTVDDVVDDVVGDTVDDAVGDVVDGVLGADDVNDTVSDLLDSL